MSTEQVFCLPHAGGGRHQYLSWAPALASVCMWTPLDYAGRFSRDDEPAYRSFADAVAALATDIESRAAGGRIGLFGHSLGGALAFEVGRLLSLRGRARLDAVVVSSAEAPSVSRAAGQHHFDLDDDGLLTHLEERGGVPTGDPLARRLLTQALPVIRADYRLHHSYRPDPDASIDVPLHVCFGSDDMTAADVAAWRHHASASVTLHRFDGGHFYWQPDREPLIDALRGIITDVAARTGHTETGGVTWRS